MANKDYNSENAYYGDSYKFYWKQWASQTGLETSAAPSSAPGPELHPKELMIKLLKVIDTLRNQLEGTDQHWKVEHHLVAMEALVHQLPHIKF